MLLLKNLEKDMFGLFGSSPVKKLEKEYNAKLTEAMNAQRSGNIQEYARLNSEAQVIFEKLETARKEN